MLLALVLFGLVTVGFVVPCLIDVAVTPPGELRSLTKPTWVLLIVFFSAFGAIAWLAAGRPDRRGRMLSRTWRTRRSSARRTRSGAIPRDAAWIWASAARPVRSRTLRDPLRTR